MIHVMTYEWNIDIVFLSSNIWEEMYPGKWRQPLVIHVRAFLISEHCVQANEWLTDIARRSYESDMNDARSSPEDFSNLVYNIGGYISAPPRAEDATGLHTRLYHMNWVAFWHWSTKCKKLSSPPPCSFSLSMLPSIIMRACPSKKSKVAMCPKATQHTSFLPPLLLCYDQGCDQVSTFFSMLVRKCNVST